MIPEMRKMNIRSLRNIFLLKDAAPIGWQSCYVKAEVMKSAVAL
jgi:hypothetical protein